VHDPADSHASLATHRDDVPSVANGDGHVGDAMMRLQPFDHALQQPNELTVGGAQLAPNAAQRR